MKKLLAIMVLSLLWSGNVHSLTFEKCYDAEEIAYKSLPKKIQKLRKPMSPEQIEKMLNDTDTWIKNGKDLQSSEEKKSIQDYERDAVLNYAGKFKKKYFDKKKYESFEWRLLPKNKSMVQTLIFTNKQVEEMSKLFYETANMTRSQVDIKKISKKYIKITLATKDYIEGNDGERYYRFNLKNGSYIRTYDKNFLKSHLFLYQCNLKGSKSKGGYLDYWWAVILILAITFFIFTQSGKRLKQIRRK